MKGRKTTVLVVDDDPQILRALRITLSARGYDVATASDGERALEAAARVRPDIYLIDLGMPRLDGVQLIHAVRGWSRAPILVVSGRTESPQKVQALDAGADDYVTKPFALDELLARIRALSRRAEVAAGEGPVTASPVLQLGRVRVDLNAHEVLRLSPDGSGSSDTVRLTPTEWKVLGLLAANAGRLVTRETMLKHIWGSEHVKDSGYLRLYMSQLRKKIEEDPRRPRHLLTEQGMGYRLVSPEQG